MASKRFTDEFKAEAVKQVSEPGYSVTEVAERLGVSSHSLYGWLRERGISREVRKATPDSGPTTGASAQWCQLAARPIKTSASRAESP